VSLWYVAHLTSYLDLASALRFEDPVQLQVKSYISDKQISKSQHLRSYNSRHNAMAYDNNINQTMCQEIGFFCDKLHADSGIQWEAPIAIIIPRMLTCITFGNSCLDEAGGYSLSLGFWWHWPFPHDIIMRMLLHKHDNSNGCLISINILEFITVIINYCTALHVILTSKVTGDPHPVLLNVTDNTSALRWTTGACQKSKLG
jgi:hypothetical protein